MFVATQNEISRQTEICFFSAEIFWAILPALIWVLVRLTKFGAWGLDDGLLLFAGKWKMQFYVASLREFFRVLAGIALNYLRSNAFFLTGINIANLHRPMADC